MVKGGIWKGSELLSSQHHYGLTSEAVSPGFEFADMTLGENEKLAAQFPQYNAIINRLMK